MALTIRTDDELELALTELTKLEDTSRQEVVRRAVLDRYERNVHQAKVRDSSRRMRLRWGDVLERLGES